MTYPTISYVMFDAAFVDWQLDRGVSVRSRRSGPLTCLYFAEVPEDALIKVGISDRPDDRLTQLSWQFGRHRTLFVVDGVFRSVESDVHAALNTWRSHGEWFRDCPDTRALVDLVLSARLDDARPPTIPRAALLLKQWRSDHQLNQTQASRVLGCSQPILSEWETGRKRPRVPFALKIATITHNTVPVEAWS